MANAAVGEARLEPAKLGSRLDSRVDGGPGRSCVTLVRQRDALVREAIRPKDLIVSCFGLVGHRGELCYRSGQITVRYLCDSEAEAAPARVEPVTDRFGEIASRFGGRARRERVTRGACCDGLRDEDLAEQPPVAQITGQADGLGQVRAGCLCVEVAGDVAAGAERPRQQGRVVDLAGDRQGLLSLIGAVGGACP